MARTTLKSPAYRSFFNESELHGDRESWSFGAERRR